MEYGSENFEVFDGTVEGSEGWDSITDTNLEKGQERLEELKRDPMVIPERFEVIAAGVVRGEQEGTMCLFITQGRAIVPPEIAKIIGTSMTPVELVMMIPSVTMADCIKAAMDDVIMKLRED